MSSDNAPHDPTVDGRSERLRLTTAASASEPWWRTYAAPLALGLWTIVQVSFSQWHRYDQLWGPVNTLFIVAVLSISPFGSSGRSCRRRYYIYLWALLAIGAATPPVEYAVRGSIPTEHAVGFVILVAGLATILVLYRRKRHPDPLGPVSSSRHPQTESHTT